MMKLKFIIGIVGSMLIGRIYALVEQKELVVVIPSYNNSQWYVRNLDSVFAQEYENYRVIYIDDVSPDNTANLVQEYLIERGLTQKCTLIKNSERTGALSNIYNAIHSCDDNVIIVCLDGDDWLKHNGVFERINQAYQTEDIWLTYGQFEHYPSGQPGFCKNIPPKIIKKNNCREYRWRTSHLRTFYAGLFKCIKLEDLMEQGSFFVVTWDMAILFPMLEMAGERIKFIDEILYVYNEATPLNDWKIRAREQARCEAVIRGLPKYTSLASLNDPC